MKKLLLSIMIMFSTIYAQHAPIVEPVYGGYITKISSVPMSTTDTRVFIAPRGENSLFYTNISNVTTTPNFVAFNIVPDFSHVANMGNIRYLASDVYSKFAFAATETHGLWGTTISAGSAYLVDSDNVEALGIYDGNLMYIKYAGGDMNLYFGQIDPATGSVGTISSTKIASSPTVPPRFDIRLVVNRYNDYVYVFMPGISPIFYKSSDVYSALSSSTTFSPITTTNLASSGYDYVAAGIAPDGRIFTMSYEGNTAGYTTNLAYSDSDGDPWIISSISHDAGRGNFAISGDASNYVVNYSRIVSGDKGANWTWTDHADGAVMGDRLTTNYAYVRTDWGFGIYDYSTNKTTEANNGIRAVEVKALGMNVGKSKAWVATKSGVFYVSDYNTSSPVWSSPIWPLGDSYPYTSSVCDQTGDLAYVGNSGGNLYRYYITNGVQDDINSYERIFAAEDDSAFPDWTWTYGTRISAVAIDHTTASERIFIGLFDEEDWDETSDHNGAIFMGENVSGTWTWTQITSTVFPDGIDVLDIIAVSEGGNTVLYVGVARNTSFATTTNGIYRIEETSTGVWSAAQDLYTSPTTPLAAYILDIAKSPSDTLHICGTDASISNPVIYKKAIGDTYWQVIPSIGFTGDELIAKSVTFDNISTTYIAVDNKIFEDATVPGRWTKFHEYPLGTEINFIYYDDLLVGTGTGLYMHPETTTAVHDESKIPDNFALHQNYPNPFNPSTEIKYELADTKHVKLNIYNALGELVKTLVNKEQHPGSYVTKFDASKLSSGFYFYTISAGNFTDTKKMMLVK